MHVLPAVSVGELYVLPTLCVHVLCSLVWLSEQTGGVVS